MSRTTRRGGEDTTQNEQAGGSARSNRRSLSITMREEEQDEFCPERAEKDQPQGFREGSGGCKSPVSGEFRRPT